MRMSKPFYSPVSLQPTKVVSNHGRKQQTHACTSGRRSSGGVHLDDDLATHRVRQ